MYYTVWKAFNKFFLKLDARPLHWEDRLTLFVAYLDDQNKQSATIKSYISAIKAVLREDGRKLLENEYLLSSLTKACRVKNNVVQIRFPIQKDVLHLIIKKLNVIFGAQPYLRKLYAALFTASYYSMFRVGEVTTGTHPILARNVQIRNQQEKTTIDSGEFKNINAWTTCSNS